LNNGAEERGHNAGMIRNSQFAIRNLLGVRLQEWLSQNRAKLCVAALVGDPSSRPTYKKHNDVLSIIPQPAQVGECG